MHQTYQDLQHFLSVWVNFNDILLNGRHLNNKQPINDKCYTATKNTCPVLKRIIFITYRDNWNCDKRNKTKNLKGFKTFNKHTITPNTACQLLFRHFD